MTARSSAISGVQEAVTKIHQTNEQSDSLMLPAACDGYYVVAATTTAHSNDKGNCLYATPIVTSSLQRAAHLE